MTVRKFGVQCEMDTEFYSRDLIEAGVEGAIPPFLHTSSQWKPN
jgi:hypothetical protein